MGTSYNVKHLNPAQQRLMLIDAKEVCYHWWADVLDCSKSFMRQKIDILFDDILDKHDANSFFSVIHRDSLGDDHVEIAFSTNTHPDYFLWLNLKPDVAKPILDNYRVYKK